MNFHSLTPYQIWEIDKFGNILDSKGIKTLLSDIGITTHHFVDNEPNELENGLEEEIRAGLWMDEQAMLQLDDQFGY